MWIDTHAHIGSEPFVDDLADVLERARNAGVTTIVCVSDDAAASERSIALAVSYSQVVATAGIHPHQAAAAAAEDLRRIRDLLDHDRVVAVGEIGLDYHYDFSPVAVQQEIFRRQIRLAHEKQLPIVVHSRKAEHDVLAILAEEGVPAAGGVLHCFWGDAAIAKRALDMGLYIGVGGPITFKNAEDLRTVVKKLPLERLLLETDAPYLAPVPYRGKRNEPAYVAETGKHLARLLERDEADVARITSENARRLFGIDVNSTNR